MPKELDARVGSSIGQAIRQARISKGESQQKLARRAGLSRGTLEKIERFDGSLDVGILNVAAAAREAGLHFGLFQENPRILERRLEQERAARRAANVREKHLRLAAELAIGDAEAVARLDDARRMVAVWRQNKSCSPKYIEGWSAILDAQPREVARKLMSIEPGWRNAMFQNTPFHIDGSESAAQHP
jgi:transcriptional regulator with XRE-family HTH domain